MQFTLARKWIPSVTVGAVALTAVLAAVMVVPAGLQADQSQAEAPMAMQKVSGTEVVTAPPLAPQSMGAEPSCANCGVVESVVAVEGYARGERQTVGYLMRVRMDDGSRRVVEHRGALAAGSRVIVDKGALRTVALQS